MRWPWSRDVDIVTDRTGETAARLERVTQELEQSTLELNELIDEEREKEGDSAES